MPATRSMIRGTVSLSVPGLSQICALAVARLTAMRSTFSMRPTTRSIREEQAAQCMPPISKRKGPAFRVSIKPPACRWS